MKLLLENWRLYVESYQLGIKRLNKIPSGSIVRKGDDLFSLWTNSSRVQLTPLQYLDINSPGGITDSSSSGWNGRAEGYIPMKKDALIRHLAKDPNWIEAVLDPERSEQLMYQFRLLQNRVMSDYRARGVAGPMFTNEFKRFHPVVIDLENLTVTLK
jgi:hypothetical protein